MRIPEEIANRVVDGSIKELYETFIILDGEYKEFSKDYEEIRYGIRVFFDIYDLIQDTNMIIPEPKNHRVYIDGTYFNIDDFRNEVEDRKMLMKEAILNNIDKAGIDIARVE